MEMNKLKQSGVGRNRDEETKGRVEWEEMEMNKLMQSGKQWR